MLAAGAGVARAEQAATGQPPAMDPAKQAAMEAMQRLGSPSEGHAALQPLAGTWTYTLQWWMTPEESPQSMAGTAVNTLIFGGRFLKQEIRGEPMEEGQPPFEGLGFTGYDNLRQEYQSVWFDNMITGMMRGAGSFDAATKTLTDTGDFSCPMTGETHRWYRSAWTVVDADHTTYESYSRTPEGQEFKSMEIRYTRAP
jgi:hypothetical protein